MFVVLEFLCYLIGILFCISMASGVKVFNSDTVNGVVSGMSLLSGFIQSFVKNFQTSSNGTLVWREHFITAFKRIRKETKDHFSALAEDSSYRLGAPYVLDAFELVERDLKPLCRYWSTLFLASSIIKEANRNRTKLKDKTKDVKQLVRLSNKLQTRIRWCLGDTPELD